MHAATLTLSNRIINEEKQSDKANIIDNRPRHSVRGIVLIVQPFH